MLARGLISTRTALIAIVPGGGPLRMDMDLRIFTPLVDTKTCGVELAYPGIWTDAEFRIEPGDSEASALWQRMNRRGLGQMPPVGTTEHDGLAHVVQSWIDGLSSADCSARGPG